jgi:hypothetical protein
MKEELEESKQREIFEVNWEELLWVNFNPIKWYSVCICVRACVYKIPFSACLVTQLR